MNSKKTDHVNGASRKNRMNQSGERKTMSDSKSENRRHVRFKVPESVCVALNNGKTVVGRVRNISLGGLAFEYIANEKQLNDASEMDIFIS